MPNQTIVPPNPKVLTGNDVILKLNGRVVGFATNLQININNNVQPIVAIGRRKPKGLKSLNWSGTASMELTILREPTEGVVKIDTNDDQRADDLYVILVLDKVTGIRVGQLIGAVNTEGFSINNNQFSSRNVDFELMDWEPMEGYN
jgi:sporulation protein YlmC with PRC-barrel domain